MNKACIVFFLSAIFILKNYFKIYSEKWGSEMSTFLF